MQSTPGRYQKSSRTFEGVLQQLEDKILHLLLRGRVQRPDFIPPPHQLVPVCAQLQRLENDGTNAKWGIWAENAGWEADADAHWYAKGKPETIFTTKGIEGFDKKIDT